MRQKIWNIIKKPEVLFLLIFVFLGFFLSQLHLFYDDPNYIFPSVAGDYKLHFKNYITNYGLFRPLALLYYYFIYSVYLRFPQLAHLIPLVIFAISTYLIYRILILQKIKKKTAFLTSLLIFSLPFSTETYSWFSATISILVFFIFFLQVYLLEKYRPSTKLLFFLIFLQIVSIFLYESTIFISPAINFYWLYKKTNALSLKKNLIELAAILLISTFYLTIYLLSKIVIRPQFATRTAWIGIAAFFDNWISSLKQLINLFSPFALKTFWLRETVDGLLIITNNSLILILFLIILFLIIYRSSTRNLAKETLFSKNNFCWLSALLLSVLPLSWQPLYLPFRTLFLPTALFLITINFLFKKIVYLLVLLIVIFLSIQVSMLTKYQKQYLDDVKIVKEIEKKTKDLGFHHPYRTNILIKNFPLNTVDNSYIYGDYVYSIFHNFWSAEALIDLNSGTVKNTAVEFYDGSYSGRIKKEKFLLLRPLTVFYFDKKNLSNSEFLKVKQVFYKKY